MRTFKRPLVIDNGSGYSKIGFAGEDSPRSVFPTLLGYLKSPTPMSNVGHSDHEYYVGEEVQLLQSVLKVVYPLKRSILTDWGAMEKIWHYIFYTELHVDPSEHPVLLTESPLIRTQHHRSRYNQYQYLDIQYCHLRP
ncbi:MAG: hypothetical protein ACFFBD_02570, partial [Candidatus Hodarchaeota archaeon]